VLKLKPRLLQNSFCRMPLLKNSDTNRRTSARVCRLRTTTGCSLFIPHFCTDLLLWNRCVARTLTNVGEH
jgi:hypothetical protein